MSQLRPPPSQRSSSYRSFYVGDPWLTDAAALAVAIATAIAVSLGIEGTTRVLLTLAFAVFVPGRAIVANWPAAQTRSQVALSVVLSISIVTLSTTLAVWLHAWDPIALFAVLEIASVLAILTAMLHRSSERRAPRRGAPPPSGRRA